MASDMNFAAWLDASGTPFVVREAPMPPAPASDEVVLRIHAVAINPFDAARHSNGMYIPSYPYIIGSDATGTIVTCGNEVKTVTAGDKVMALTDEYITHLSSHSFFQRFAVMGSKMVCKIPDGLTYEDACVLPMGVCTAAGMLFEKESLDLEWPTLNDGVRAKRKHEGEIVVVWGASSSVGCSAMQLLRAAGYRVLATASRHNFDLLKQCGAEAVFDHTDAGCVDRVCSWVEEKKLQLAGVLAVVINPELLQKCGQVAQRLPGNKFVSTSLPRGLMPEPDLGEGIRTSNCKSMLLRPTKVLTWLPRSGYFAARSPRVLVE